MKRLPGIMASSAKLSAGAAVTAVAAIAFARHVMSAANDAADPQESPQAVAGPAAVEGAHPRSDSNANATAAAALVSPPMSAARKPPGASAATTPQQAAEPAQEAPGSRMRRARGAGAAGGSPSPPPRRRSAAASGDGAAGPSSGGGRMRSPHHVWTRHDGAVVDDPELEELHLRGGFASPPKAAPALAPAAPKTASRKPRGTPAAGKAGPEAGDHAEPWSPHHVWLRREGAVEEDPELATLGGRTPRAGRAAA